jgi:hypothetical protein
MRLRRRAKLILLVVGTDARLQLGENDEAQKMKQVIRLDGGRISDKN